MSIKLSPDSLFSISRRLKCISSVLESFSECLGSARFQQLPLPHHCDDFFEQASKRAQSGKPLHRRSADLCCG
ncbi:hypothetical protein [Roseibium polysiphoniae]|uniref:hypothetical protein n=1 Tax=Roseibium polysiphoniae TaxID=2571221 RepID=UPI00329A4CF2